MAEKLESLLKDHFGLPIDPQPYTPSIDNEKINSLLEELLRYEKPQLIPEKIKTSNEAKYSIKSP